MALEDLGPIFVKFGQILSTRRDLLPDDLADELEGRGVSWHLIGGAKKAAELDAKYAIREGSELAAKL